MRQRQTRPFPIEADRYLRDPRHRARYFELLRPEETANPARRVLSGPKHRGWSGRIELQAKEI